MKTKNLILILFMAALLFILGCGQQYVEPENPIKKFIPAETQTSDSVVVMTDDGYEPKTLTINSGETVLFKNEGTGKNWPASAIHPTHQVYPGSDIKKCGTSEEPNIFDACRGLAEGESYSFKFTEKGTWNYHNHLNPGMTGKIIVE